MALVIEGYLAETYKWVKENFRYDHHFQGSRSPNQGSLTIDLRKIADDVYVDKKEPRVRVTIERVRQSKSSSEKGSHRQARRISPSSKPHPQKTQQQ